MFPLILTPTVTTALCVLAARTIGIGPLADIHGERNEEIERNPVSSSSAISETLHLTYLDQIASAQAYLNENHQADLSRVQCLLRKMLPDPYHKAIADLHENQDPSIIYNIFGGVHQHAPNATRAEQKKYVR